ncbi:MAG: hypothetical protein GYB48_15160 [Gammaproteobacteria bacterium]|nr:hypothetical protein [Gammaproteobacteria bacterium]
MTAALCAVSNAAFADNGESDIRVREALSESRIMGQAQPAERSTQVYVESGMSVAAGRVQHALSEEGSREHARKWAIEDKNHATDFVNDAGKSVPATRIEHALSESA